MSSSRPPFELTPAALSALSAIERMVGRLEGLQAPRPQPLLRKQNRVRTVQGSVAIEGNTLSLEQVTALLEGKRVVGSPREILEIQNALEAYELAPGLQAWRQKDLLKAHGVLLRGLLEEAGRFRRGSVGVFRGRRVAHLAPPADRVAALVSQLFAWGRESRLPTIVKAAVAHYELLFIHPFGDGNGRVARLWQHVVLLGASPAFEFLPVESLIRDRQAQYYEALGRSDQSGSSTAFLEFSLETLRDGLETFLTEIRPGPQTPERRLESASEAFGGGWFSRADYLRLHKALSTATASRDLRQGVEAHRLERRGEGRNSVYRFSSRGGTKGGRRAR